MIVHKIILSRTDSIGDVILTLPMAGILKEMFPQCKIIFLGSNYTREVVALSDHVDEFISRDIVLKQEGTDKKIEYFKEIGADTIIHVYPNKEIAYLSKKAQIQNRIGTTGRLYHYINCNKLVRLSRKRSDLHEAQLNLKLLQPLGWNKELSLNEIATYYGFNKKPTLSKEFSALIDPQKTNLILHPKSKGSAREWGLVNFEKLIDLLDKKKYKIFVTGTEAEGKLLREKISFTDDNYIDLSGKMSLKQLIAFIDKADGLVAASTGPLHIAAALGKLAIGIYPPIKPMHPGRWAPLGSKAKYIVQQKECNDCKSGNACHCMAEIEPQKVLQILEDSFGI